MYEGRHWHPLLSLEERILGDSCHEKFVHAYLNSAIPTKFVHAKDCRVYGTKATMYDMYKFQMYQVPYS